MSDVGFFGILVIIPLVFYGVMYISENIKDKSTKQREQIIKNHLLSLIIINNIKFNYSKEEKCYLVSSNNKDLGILDVKWYGHFTINEELAVTEKQRYILNELKKNQRLLGDLVYQGENKNVFKKTEGVCYEFKY